MTGSESGDAGLSASIARALTELWSAPVTVRGLRAFGDGHSGFTYLADLDGAGWSGEYVVRLSPPGARIAGPADVGRQGRLMAALGRHGLPVPQIIAADSSGLADGRALVVMQRVAGTGWAAAAGQLGDHAVAELAVGFLRRLGEVDPLDLALSEPAVSLPAELDRWRGLLRYCPDWLAGPGDRLYRVLVADLPGPGPARVVHGDFHYGNMLFRSGSLAGVLDWEIATVGDQRFDLGCLAVASLRRRYPEPNPTGGLEVSLSELARMSAVPADEARWFAAAGCLKYAAILGYNLGLHRKGRRVDPLYEQLVLTMRGLAADGLTLAHGDDLTPPAG